MRRHICRISVLVAAVGVCESRRECVCLQRDRRHVHLLLFTSLWSAAKRRHTGRVRGSRVHDAVAVDAQCRRAGLHTLLADGEAGVGRDRDRGEQQSPPVFHSKMLLLFCKYRE